MTSPRPRRFSIAASSLLIGFSVVAAFVGVSVPAAATARAAALPRCGTMHVRALQTAGYKTERLVVARSLSCANGRRYVNRYYTSHASCQGSGCFRVIGNLSCGGNQSSILGGVALQCTLRRDPSDVFVELRVRPKPPAPSLQPDHGTGLRRGGP